MLEKTIVRKKMKRKIDRKKERNALDQHIIVHSRVVPFEIYDLAATASGYFKYFLWCTTESTTLSVRRSLQVYGISVNYHRNKTSKVACPTVQSIFQGCTSQRKLKFLMKWFSLQFSLHIFICVGLTKNRGSVWKVARKVKKVETTHSTFRFLRVTSHTLPLYYLRA